MSVVALQNGAQLRAVIVEDEALVAEDVRGMMQQLGYSVLGIASRADEAIALVRRTLPDIVLMDIHLKDGSSGITAADAVTRELRIPVVFSTAYADAGTLDRAAATGPFGYVVKPFHQRELAAALSMAMYRHAADQRLREMERWLSMTLGSIADAVLAADMQGRITFINPAAEAITGWSRAEAIGRAITDVFVVHSGGESLPVADPVRVVLESGVTFHLTQDTELQTRTGRTLPIDDSIAPLRSATGEIDGVVIIFRDRSAAKRAAEERREIEMRMLEAQRLESLGVLAGGIAHDFNNLLSIIIGNVSLAEGLLAPGSDAAPLLRHVVTASNRAASLSQQMLAYAGRAPRLMRAINLSEFVGTSVALLHTAVHQRVALSMDLAPGLPAVDADEAQLQQVLMNLVLNASDAIGERGGTISVRTEAVHLEGGGVSHLVLTVSDDGPGMPEAVRQRIFEPFFTTKMLGRGLGLSAVQGIVREHGGTIEVVSAEGFGAQFRISFPIGRLASMPDSRPTLSRFARFSGTVLVVDDDDAVRSATRRLVQRTGFDVVEANGMESAMATVDRDISFTAAVIDVTMPHFSGPEVGQRLRTRLPGLPILYISGYDESDALAGVDQTGQQGFLQKPFSAQAMEAALRELLRADLPPSP